MNVENSLSQHKQQPPPSIGLELSTSADEDNSLSQFDFIDKCAEVAFHAAKKAAVQAVVPNLLVAPL